MKSPNFEGRVPVRRPAGSAASRFGGLLVRRTPGSHELWSALPITAIRGTTSLRNQESAEPGVRGTGTPRNWESAELGLRNRDSVEQGLSLQVKVRRPEACKDRAIESAET